MNNFELLGFSILGISVLIHIIVVNITLGTGWISAMARFLGWVRAAPELEVMSRRVFKILVIHELFSGVWGTIITVILAGFFPTLTAIATDIVFYPLILALTSIFIRIPTIALFWYTWGKVKPVLHSALGFVMALSGFGIPFGFRYLFAEVTYPYGLALALQGLRDAARVAVFSNPLYLPLIMHTWAGAMSIGGFMVASFFAIKGNVNAKFAWIGLWHGVLFLGVQGIMGPSYLFSLGRMAPLLYSNILGTINAAFDVFPIFATKMIVIGVVVVFSLKAWRSLKRGFGVVPRYLLLLGPLAVVVAAMGEFMNDGGRYPYLVILGQGGIGPGQFMNAYTNVSLSVVYVIIAVLIAFTGLFMATAYYALNRRFLADVPDEITNATKQGSSNMLP